MTIPFHTCLSRLELRALATRLLHEKPRTAEDCELVGAASRCLTCDVELDKALENVEVEGDPEAMAAYRASLEENEY